MCGGQGVGKGGGGDGIGVYDSCHAPLFFHPWTPLACTITLNKTGAMHVVSQNSMLANILPKTVNRHASLMVHFILLYMK